MMYPPTPETAIATLFGDIVSISVNASNASPTGGFVYIEQSPTAAGPWYPFQVIPVGALPFPLPGVVTSGGLGGSFFLITSGMKSFYLRAWDGVTSNYGKTKITTSLIQVLVPQPPPPETTMVTINSLFPNGPGYVQVDGVPINTPQTFNWIPGSAHVIAANSPVQWNGYGWFFQSWSDGGPSTHTLTVPATSTTYTANYDPLPPPTPITRIRYARGTASSGLSIPVTIAPPVNGNTLIAVIGVYGSNNLTVSSITQTGANWVRDVSRQTGDGTGDVEIWRASNVQNAESSITVNLAGSGTLNEAIAEVCEYSGLTNTNPLDRTGTNTGVSGTPTIGTMIGTVQGNELWIAGITHLGNDTQTNPTMGFKFTDPQDGVATNNMSLGYLENLTPSSSTPLTGVTVSSNSFAACIATYKSS